MTEKKPAPAPIPVRWRTGSIEIMPDAFFPCTAAKLRQLMSTAEIDREETAAAFRSYLEARRAEYADDESKAGKRAAARWAALLDVLDPPEKKTPAVKAAERIAAESKDIRPDYKGVFESGGKYCVCNGYLLIRFNEPVPLPKVRGGLDAAEAVRKPSTFDEPFPLPALKEAKNLLKLARALQPGTWAGKVYRLTPRGYFYDPGEGAPAVDLEYLVDTLEALPDCRAWYSSENAPIYFTAENGDGLLLPMRKEPRYYTSRPAVSNAVGRSLTPEEFTEAHAPVAMTPEEFAACYAA